MGWDISSVAADKRFYFEKAIPRDADTFVTVACNTPAINLMLQEYLASRVLQFGEDVMRSEWTKNWERIKEIALAAAMLESNLINKGKSLFPKRDTLKQKFNQEEFESAWNQLRPSELTDEMMVFFLKANPSWHKRFKQEQWYPTEWAEQWLGDWEPEDLGEGSKDSSAM